VTFMSTRFIAEIEQQLAGIEAAGLTKPERAIAGA